MISSWWTSKLGLFYPLRLQDVAGHAHASLAFQMMVILLVYRSLEFLKLSASILPTCYNQFFMYLRILSMMHSTPNWWRMRSVHMWSSKVYPSRCRNRLVSVASNLLSCSLVRTIFLLHITILALPLWCKIFKWCV